MTSMLVLAIRVRIEGVHKGTKACLNGFRHRFLHTEHISKPSITTYAVKFSPSSSTYSTVKDARLSLASSLDKDMLRWNMAVADYMRTGRCQSAIDVFNSMPRRSIVSWNSVICGFLWNNLFDHAKKMFDRMPERDVVSWNVMISGCIRYHNLTRARMLFQQMPEKDVVSWNTMLSGYARNGYVDEARGVFDRMPNKNSVSWNAILAAYVQNGRIEEAGQLFDSKADWELISWNCMLAGYVRKKSLMDAKLLFDKMPERDVVSWSTMISAYAQNGDMSEARRLFNKSPVRDVFTWTAMVSGYVQNGMIEKAKHVFDEMPEMNSVSWNAMIAGYVQCGKIDSARKLFEAMPCRNVSTWNTMITGYAQCGDISFARKLFDEMPERDCVSWAAIIAGYAQSGLHEEALHLFLEMKRIGKVNRSSISCILSSCADIAALELGKQVHGRAVKAGFEGGYFVGNAVLWMYSKCGSIEEAYEAFQEISKKDVVSWNTMIHGYGIHGFGKEALQVFNSMELAGTKPDEATMVAVLSACSHTGLVDKGKEFFYSMNRDYGIVANSKHYTCMIDLLGRAGCLNEALKLIQNIPFEPDAAMWGALLGASRIYGNTELGEKAAKRVFEMQPENSGMYILLSNIYASYGRWRDADKMRWEMQNRGVKKVPGCSWMEVQSKIHTFCVGDCHHPERK